MNDDLKLVPPGNLTPEQLKAWNAAYDPKNEAFEKANLQGEDLVRWKYQRYMQGLPALRRRRRRQRRPRARLPRRDRPGREHGRHLLLRPGLLPRRARLVRQALDVRGVAAHAAARALAGRKSSRGRSTRDLVSNLDFAETFLDIAGVEVPDDMQGRSLVPLLKGETPDDWRTSFYYHYYEYPGRTQRAAALRRARRSLQIDLLRSNRRVGTVRPGEGPPRATKLL